MVSQSPPHDKDNEKALLGSMLIDPAVITKVSMIVKHTDFYDPYHRQLYNVILIANDANQPIEDVVVLKQSVTAMGVEWNAGYLAELLNIVPTSRNACEYAHNVRQLSRRRQVIDLSRELVAKANNPTSELDDITSYARQYIELMELGSNRNMPGLVGDAMQLVVDDLNQERRRLAGISSGFPTIDEHFGMMQPSELTTIGARPGGGKTTFN